MKTLVTAFVALLSLINVYGQTAVNPYAAREQSLKEKFDTVMTIEADESKLAFMKMIEDSLAKLLLEPGTYNYPFDSLKTVGKIKSPDDEFRIISWNTKINDDSLLNFSIIQFNPRKEVSCKVIVLHDKSEIDKVGNIRLSSNGWYGALYYKIIPVKVEGKTYYTLLGLDSFSPYVSKRVIDVLYFDNGEAFFGAPIFNVAGKAISRMVFSYSARVSMMLNYDETLKTIVFDHLAPREPRYTGQFEFYGPDFSFDGFIFNKNSWQFIEDVKPNRPVTNGKKERKQSNRLR
ncbi:MAG TPA: hypothetical protein VHO90_04500 [Bacteroidales bacterium]|nr:hypothetical protein [Bacteroidales bacterium]